VRIVSAILHGEKHAGSITLLNRSDKAVDMSGWYLSCGKKFKRVFNDCMLDSGSFMTVSFATKNVFKPAGGLISLYNAQGVKIHGVSYTTPDYSLVDCSTVF
jgi:hypothetical protein